MRISVIAGDIKTPNIDKLANEGVRLEKFYGKPVCTPSRAALMTGRYPMRHGLQTLVIFPNHTLRVADRERTLPQSLKEAGYSTYGRQMAPRSRRQEILAAEPRVRLLLWQRRRRSGLFHQERGGMIDWQRNGKFFKRRASSRTPSGTMP